MTDNAESDRGPTCEPKCHAWGIGCACSGARVYQHPTPDTADCDRADALAALCRRVIDVHAQVVMDTPEDRELHDRAVATFRRHLDLLTRPTTPGAPS